MEALKETANRLRRWEYSGLCFLLLVILVLHFSTIMLPSEPFFDEKHYVPDARLIIQGEGTARLTHPPLGKLFIVAGIKIFGDNPIGWRFFSVLLGTAGVWLGYLICRRLNLSQRVSLLATFLLALENLTFVQASTAMLDVYSLFFALLGFWLYLRGNNLTAGMALGLCALAKLSGLLAIAAIGLHWLLTGRQRPWHFLTTMLTSALSFLLFMPLFDFFIWGDWRNPIYQIQLMLSRTRGVTFAGYQATHQLSYPWEWIIFPEALLYRYQPNYIGMLSPTLWVLTIPTIIYIIFKTIKGDKTFAFLFAWFTGTYLLWIPLILITDRAAFIFYFYPTVGAICIGLALGLSRLRDIAKQRQKGRLFWAIKIGVPLYLLLHAIAFMVLAPVSLWWSIPLCLLLYAAMLYSTGLIIPRSRALSAGTVPTNQG